MIGWIIIIIFILIIIFFTRMEHFKKKTFILIIIFLILFFYSTLLIVNSKNKLDFSTSEGFMNSAKIYGGWLANGLGNFKSIIGNAVKMDWTSTNGTFSLKNQSSTIKLSNKPSVNK